MAYTVTVTRDGEHHYSYTTEDAAEAQRVVDTQHERIVRFGDHGDYSINLELHFSQ